MAPTALPTIMESAFGALQETNAFNRGSYYTVLLMGYIPIKKLPSESSGIPHRKVASAATHVAASTENNK